jgi:hypothetical protein
LKRFYITFGGKPYDNQTKLIVERAPQFGADRVIVYDDRWFMAHDFVKLNRWLSDHPHKRGCLWYSWKPLIIMETMKRMEDGDVVLFTDADCYPVAPFGHLYEQCDLDGGIMLFRAHPHKNYQWCKRDCYIVMAQDEPRYHDRTLDAGVARFCLFQKGPWRAQQFLSEWLTYCINPLATTFDPSVLGREDEGFKEHRTEQAIMTLLAYKYGLKLYPEADYEQHLFDQQNMRPLETRQQTAPVEGSEYCNV